jgi:hypothetical protein
VALRAHQAIIKLNHFGANELTNEPVDDVINSFTVFVGTFTLLSNIFAMPNISCVGLHNIESIVSTGYSWCDNFMLIFTLLGDG